MNEIKSLYDSRLPSNEFRLLRILEKDSSGILRCSLQAHNLSSAPRYNALSYSWGFVDVSHTIKCDGHEVLVSRSVHTALNTLYELDLVSESKPLWIDAVCINQRDTTEKTQQVRMMQKIYERAETVLIWLGEESPSEARGLEFLRRLWNVLQEEGDFEDLDADELTRLGLPQSEHHLWDDALAFLGKPWFTRVWIIQELVCSTNALLVSGKRTVPPKQIFETCVALWDSNHYRVNIFGTRHAARNTGNAIVLWNMYKLREKGKSLDLTYCLMHGSPFTATDKRDKIFAMTAICDQKLTKIIDYEKTLPEVLIETTKALFDTQIYPLDILCYARTMERGDHPSWVTNWTSDSVAIRSLLEPTETPQAGAQQPRTFRFGEDNTLVVNSVAFDRISRLTKDTIPRWDDWMKTGREIRVAEARCQVCRSILANNFVSRISGSNSILEDLDNASEAFVECYLRLVRCHNEALHLSRQITANGTEKDAYWYTLNHGKQLDTPQGSVEGFQKIAAKFDGAFEISAKHEPALGNQSFIYIFVSFVSILLFLVTFPSFYTGYVSTSIARYFGFPVWTSLIVLAMILILGTVWLDMRKREELLKLLLHRRRVFEEVSQVAAGFAWRNRGRRFGLTDKGYLCWAPAWAQIDDEVCAFEGSRFPFLTRSIDAGTGADKRELLGDIYLHGVMDDVLSWKGEKMQITFV